MPPSPSLFLPLLPPTTGRDTTGLRRRCASLRLFSCVRRRLEAGPAADRRRLLPSASFPGPGLSTPSLSKAACLQADFSRSQGGNRGQNMHLITQVKHSNAPVERSCGCGLPGRTYLAHPSPPPSRPPQPQAPPPTAHTRPQDGPRPRRREGNAWQKRRSGRGGGQDLAGLARAGAACQKVQGSNQMVVEAGRQPGVCLADGGGGWA